MTKLELVYLMNVALHLESIEDVMNFESINKKSREALLSLHVNPWLKTQFKSDFRNDIQIKENSIEKFQKIFKKTTCNCSNQFVSSKILDECEKIRNLNIYIPGNHFTREICPIFSLYKFSYETEIEKLLKYVEKSDSILFYF